MPNQPPHLRKKKKGPAPAHQNSFAFIHNAKSKKTDAILNSPNVHVCRRCHDKIEWRKRYRKYKPRTQPGTCNACQQRNVLAAYHTICTNCSIHSDKAKQVLKEFQQQKQDKQDKRQQKREQRQGGEYDDDEDDEDDDDEEEDQDDMDNMDEDEDEEESGTAALEPTHHVEESDMAANTTAAATTATTSDASSARYFRVCAMCVKEPALLDDDDDDPSKQRAETDESRRLRLRERKTIERQLERQEQQAKQAAKEARRRAREGGGGGTAGEGMNGANNDQSKMEEGDSDDVSLSDDDLLDDPDDPFLQAIGGADKFLVGEAYQQQLLQKSGDATK